MQRAVIYVHGLWMTGLEGFILRARLAHELNASAPRFSYPSLTQGIDVLADRLASFISRLRASTVDLVGHSLGGVVILKMFERHDSRVPNGRVVLLGSPVRGSRTAHLLANWKLGPLLMGRCASKELTTPRNVQWPHERDLGVIAGDRPIGLGRLIGNDYKPSDGTVLVDETYVSGMKQHAVLRVSHTGLPFSGEVARQTAAFLRSGHFET